MARLHRGSVFVTSRRACALNHPSIPCSSSSFRLVRCSSSQSNYRFPDFRNNFVIPKKKYTYKNFPLLETRFKLDETGVIRKMLSRIHQKCFFVRKNKYNDDRSSNFEKRSKQRILITTRETKFSNPPRNEFLPPISNFHQNFDYPPDPPSSSTTLRKKE